MYHANGKSQRKGITRSCSPEYGMFSAHPHLPDVLDAKHYGVAVYIHTGHGFGLVFCVGVFFWGGGEGAGGIGLLGGFCSVFMVL